MAEGVGWNGCSREHTDDRSGQGPHRSWSSSSWRRIGAGATGWGAASSSTFAAPFASRWSSHLLPAQGRPQARQGGVGLPRRTASSVHGTGRTCAVQTPCRAERDSAPLVAPAEEGGRWPGAGSAELMSAMFTAGRGNPLGPCYRQGQAEGREERSRWMDGAHCVGWKKKCSHAALIWVRMGSCACVREERRGFYS